MSLTYNMETIQSRDDLVLLIRSLLHSLRDEQGACENSDLDSYLDALAAWIEDMDGYYESVGEPPPVQPTWKTFGEMLLAATQYE